MLVDIAIPVLVGTTGQFIALPVIIQVPLMLVAVAFQRLRGSD